MAHFDPQIWEIDLRSFTKAQLDTDPVVQAVFIHEYIHYLLLATI